jgi:predicted dehydrogenase
MPLPAQQPPAADSVRIGIAGIGNWGRLHAETLAALPGVRLAAICDPDAVRRAEVLESVRRTGEGRPAAAASTQVPAASAPEPRAYDSFEACVRDADLDAVLVATKDEQHTAHAVAALERGWHVFVEKPLALSLQDARAVHQAAARARKVAMVGTILRFSVPHRQLADAVHLGRIGRLLHLRSVRYVTTGWLARTPVHTALRLSIHDIDLVLWLAGRRVVRAAAAGHTLPGEDRPRSLVGLLWMDGGASAVVETHYVLPSPFPSNTLPPEAPGTRVGMVEVFGTEGIARLDDSGGLSVWNRDGGYSPDLFMTSQIGGRIVGAMRAELEHFVSCVAAGRPSEVAPLADSVHATAVAEAIIRAERSATIEPVEEST